jgi:hypothetical protein
MFENPEHQDITGCIPAAFTISPPPEADFIDLSGVQGDNLRNIVGHDESIPG